MPKERPTSMDFDEPRWRARWPKAARLLGDDGPPPAPPAHAIDPLLALVRRAPSWEHTWAHYGTTYRHAAVYVTAFVGAVALWDTTGPCTLSLLHAAWLAPLGAFGLVGMLSLGHDAGHGCCGPPALWLGRRINDVAGFLFLDCLVCSRRQWEALHRAQDHGDDAHVPASIAGRGCGGGAEADHVPYTGVPERFRSSSVVLNCIMPVVFFCEALLDDLVGAARGIFFCAKPSKSGGVRHVVGAAGAWFKAWSTLLGMCLRTCLWYYTVGPILAVQMAFFASIYIHLAFNVPHMCPRGADETQGVAVLQGDLIDCVPSVSAHAVLATTWDILPESRWAALLLFGLNCHATHHLIPRAPRGAVRGLSREVEALVGTEYRACRSVSALVQIARRGHAEWVS